MLSIVKQKLPAKSNRMALQACYIRQVSLFLKSIKIYIPLPLSVSSSDALASGIDDSTTYELECFEEARIRVER